jgi:DHA2 family multidrug resistance protein
VPQGYIGVGFLVFFLFTLMMHNNMTPNTGEDDMYWALILRGIGLDYYLFPSPPIAIYFIWEKYW